MKLKSPLCFLLSMLASDAGAADLKEVLRVPVQERKFMGSVLVMKGETVLLDQGYGFANLEWEIPNTPSTRFRIGSLTKQFTAAAILLLEEHGKLRLDDPVKKHLPTAPAAWDAITFFHLLTHSSGIPNLDSGADVRTTPLSPEQLVLTFKDKPLDFEPGKGVRYSNCGFLLLGYLIERISGRTYPDFLRENIFMPLNLRDSGYDFSEPIIPRRAAGYKFGADGVLNADPIEMSVPFSAGGLYSTSHDLVAWQRALYLGKFLRPESLQKMTTPIPNGPGMGIGVGPAPKRKFSHAGGISGFGSNLAYYPDEEISVVVLANIGGAPVSEISSFLAAIAKGEVVTLPSERNVVTLSADTLAKYVGNYELAPPNANLAPLMLTVALKDNRLIAQVPGRPKEELFASDEKTFFLKADGTQLEFILDDEGQVAKEVVISGNGRIKGTRK